MKTKKGFTLVELLVVIAILAILATVSIVGYTSFIKKANYSNDETLVTQWNTLLKGKDILNETPDNINEVKDFFKENGSEDKDFIPQSDGYYFYWNETDNKIYLKESTYNKKDTDYRLDLTWHKVTFDFNDDYCTDEDIVIFVAEGEKITSETHDSITIEMSTYNITGWYYINDNDEHVDWDLENTIESDLILYANRACFVAGTKITMADGSYKNIEDIKIGDKVLAYDTINNCTYKTVVITKSENVSKMVVTIILTDGTKVECTPTHPLFTIDGFKSVNPNYTDVMIEYHSTELKIGDMVITDHGTFAVESISKEEKAVPVYNFHVQSNGCEANCTYFANGVVAHNGSGC